MDDLKHAISTGLDRRITESELAFAEALLKKAAFDFGTGCTDPEKGLSALRKAAYEYARILVNVNNA